MTETELQDRITLAPFHKWLGLELVEMGEDGIKLRVPWREEFVVNPKAGYTHGGILATIIDIAADYALAAKIGAPIPTEARLIKLGRTFSTAEAFVTDSEGALLASGRGVYHSPSGS
jgi:acyl-coenzyme A thioesterase PaaI-like protein